MDLKEANRGFCANFWIHNIWGLNLDLRLDLDVICIFGLVFEGITGIVSLLGPGDRHGLTFLLTLCFDKRLIHYAPLLFHIALFDTMVLFA